MNSIVRNMSNEMNFFAQDRGEYRICPKKGYTIQSPESHFNHIIKSLTCCFQNQKRETWEAHIVLTFYLFFHTFTCIHTDFYH